MSERAKAGEKEGRKRKKVMDGTAGSERAREQAAAAVQGVPVTVLFRRI
jgi:hypothetical protein